MKAKDISPHDHTHTCAVCSSEWVCVAYPLKECKQRGVFKAAKQNGTGPYCWACFYLTMALRHLGLRVGREELMHYVNLARVYEEQHQDQGVFHPFDEAKKK